MPIHMSFFLQPSPPSKDCMRLQMSYVWRQSIGVNTAHSLGNLREVNSKQHDHVSGGSKSVWHEASQCQRGAETHSLASHHYPVCVDCLTVAIWRLSQLCAYTCFVKNNSLRMLIF